MFPFKDKTFARLENAGDGVIKIGYHYIRPGEFQDVHVSTLTPPAITVGERAGLQFVGLVINDRLYRLCECGEPSAQSPPKEGVEVAAPSVPEPVLEEVSQPAPEEPAPIPAEPAPAPSYATMYKKELVALALERGLDPSGLNKVKLVDLLVENDQVP